MSVEGPGPPEQPSAAPPTPSSADPPAPLPPRRGGFWKGLGLGFLLHLFQILALSQSFLLTVWGLTQVAYMIPAAIYFKRRGEPDTVKGLMVAAAVSFLLNAACWGLFMFTMGNFR